VELETINIINHVRSRSYHGYRKTILLLRTPTAIFRKPCLNLTRTHSGIMHL